VLVRLAGRGADIDRVLNLNRVGTFIWELLDGHNAGSAVVDRLIEQFEVERPEAEADYLRFLAQLREVNAIVLAGAEEG